MKKIFCCPVIELFHCLPLWKTVLFVRSRAFSLLSTPVENSEATWKKATKCNKCSTVPTLHHLFVQSYQRELLNLILHMIVILYNHNTSLIEISHVMITILQPMHT
jgi:hypothetical protein